MDGALRKLRSSLQGLKALFRSPDLARLVLAWGLITFAGWAFVIAMSVYAFHHGGVWAVGIAAFVRLLPGAFASPVAGLLGDRNSKRLVLVLSTLAGAVILVLAAEAVAAHSASWIVYALGGISTIVVSPYVPAEGALLPQVARTPQELSIANVAHNQASNLGFLGAALTTGVLMSAIGLEAAFIVAAAAGLLATAVLATLTRDAPPRYEPDETALGMVRETLQGFRAVHHDRKLRLLDNVGTANDFIEGVANVMTVIIALDLLGRGEGTVGYLHASWAVGALLAGGALAMLYRRGNLTAGLAIGCLLTSSALAVPGVWPELVVAYLSFLLIGFGYASVKVTARTLLQRLGDPETLARAIAYLETNRFVALAAGSLAGPALVELIGIRPALFAFGVLLAGVALARWQALRAFEIRAPVPERHYALLRGNPIFAPLPVDTLEGVTHGLIEVDAVGGEVITAVGDVGDRFYVIDSGEVEVIEDGVVKRKLGEGECFGEIALLRDVPRTATVRAIRDTRLLAIQRDHFLTAVTGHRRSSRRADAVASGWLGPQSDQVPLEAAPEPTEP